RVSRQHFAYFLALAEDLEPRLKGSDQQIWLDRLESEHDNVRAALAWSLSRDGIASDGLRLAGAVSWFWYIRGYPVEGYRWLTELLSVVPAAQAAPVRAKALDGACYLALEQSDFPAVWSQCEESLAIYRTIGDRAGISRALNIMGTAALDQGDYSA